MRSIDAAGAARGVDGLAEASAQPQSAAVPLPSLVAVRCGPGPGEST
ncbi:hypothetical protein [Kitasatospora kifunensis]|uniref:Uncharacterized protein n=1 Tax=Kitasatospora kifunensis TaxID=58351 RepID=A0A7W7R3H0_KITKI|nr:hypothetical protein [Kitasatospora kifunensis]MBB4924560.1 hypothetical protein [Kitasatospora kifunensis]